MKVIKKYADKIALLTLRACSLKRSRGFIRTSCLLIVVSCFHASILTNPLANRSVSYSAADRLELSAGRPLTIRLRAVLQVGTNSDKPLMSFSGDGQVIAIGTGKGPVKIWNALTGALIATLDGTNGQSPRAFSPVNDRLLASANLKSVSLYDINAMKLRSQIVLDKLFGGLNFFGSFSPDGQEFIINSEDKGKVSLWDVKTARLIVSVPCREILFQSRFSHDSQTFLTACGDRIVTLWDTQTGKAMMTFSNPNDVSVSALSPDSKTVVTATLQGQVLIWDASNGQLIKSWQGHRDLISYAGFSHDGKIIATVSRDGDTKLWDIENLKLKHTLRSGSSALYAVFSPDSKLVVIVGEGKREFPVWDVSTGVPVFNITGHRKEIFNVEFSNDGLLASSSDDTVNVWDVANKKHVARLSDASFPVQFSKDGRTIATSGLKGTVSLWDVAPQ